MVTWGMVVTPDMESVPPGRKSRFAREVRIPGLGFRRSRGNDSLASDPGAGSRPACVFAGDARRGRRVAVFDSTQPANCKGRSPAGQGKPLGSLEPARIIDSQHY